MEKVLFYFLTVAHFSSGIGFLFKIEGMYHPDAYIVNGKPGDGTTEFENLARIPFGLCYIAPFIGVIYAHMSGSQKAKRAAMLCPIIYHLVSAFACIYVFNDALNSDVVPISFAAGMHFGTLVLCCLYFGIVVDTKPRQTKRE